MDRRRLLALALMTFFMAGFATADIVTFSGQDDGSPTTGPFPNSIAAYTQFATAGAALSPLGTITFENQPIGFNSNFSAAAGVNITIINAPDFGDGITGISTTTFGNLYGFNTTPGGSKWLGFPGWSAEVTFAEPTDYFGFWLTGVQSRFSPSEIAVTFHDGTAQILEAPISENGGAAFFGFTDAGKSISAITISNFSGDFWGIDDVAYNAVPEPSSVLLLGACAFGLARLLSRVPRE